MSITSRRRLAHTVAAAAAGLTIALGSPAVAQTADDPTPADLLNDFTYYVNIARLDLAEANAVALLDSGISPRDFVELIETEVGMAERFDRAYRRALRFPDIEDEAARLNTLFESGMRERARDLDQIKTNIQLLKGNARQRLLGAQRLIEASQYAVPELVQVLVEGGDPLLEAEIQQVLIDLGTPAVAPLCQALPQLNAPTQEVVCILLGQINNQSALPFLYDIEASTTERSVREAAQIAIRQIDGSFDSQVRPAGLYRDLASRVIGESGSYTAFPGEPHQLLWNYDPQIGLIMIPVRSPVYHEARTMELAERALTLDPADIEAVALWIRANFKRENETPDGYDNPAYGADRREAEYYAVSAGSAPLQLILGGALERGETLIARRAIASLERIAGSDTLLRDITNRTPALIDALTYPDRRVRHEAALAIATAQPQESFQDAERVVPTLAAILRDPATRYALVISSDSDRQAEIRAALEPAGFTVLPPATSLDRARDTLIEAPGIDILVSDIDGDEGIELLRSVRAAPRLRATPAIGLMPFDDLNRFRAAVQSDQLTDIARDGISREQLRNAAEQLVARNVGAPLSDSEAMQYSIRALNALYDLAIASDGALSIDAASGQLLVALERNSGEIAFRIAEILSFIDQQRIQVGIMDAALDASGSDRVRLLNIVASSAKRFGNMLEQRQIRQLIDIADADSDAQATAAAALIGALDLPNDRIVPLIISR